MNILTFVKEKKKKSGVTGCSDCSPVKGQAADQVTKPGGGGGGGGLSYTPAPSRGAFLLGRIVTPD